MQAVLCTEGERQNDSRRWLDKRRRTTHDQAAVLIEFRADPFPDSLNNIRMTAKTHIRVALAFFRQQGDGCVGIPVGKIREHFLIGGLGYINAMFYWMTCFTYVPKPSTQP